MQITPPKRGTHTTVATRVEVLKYDRKILSDRDQSAIAIVETKLKEKFVGVVEGLGHATHLRLERADGSGNLICYERFVGSIDGRRGSFILEASGFTDQEHIVHGRWEVVPNSGTEQLTGIRGYAAFSAAPNPDSPTGWLAETSLTYWFAAETTA
jgi:hypothetical protein